MAQEALDAGGTKGMESGIEDSQNSRLVQGFISACNSRNVDGALAHLDSDVVIQPLRVGTEAHYRGHDGFRAMFDSMSTRVDHHIELSEVRSVSPTDLLLVGTIVIGEQRIPFAGIHSTRDGKITAVRHYVSTEVALRQVGAID